MINTIDVPLTRPITVHGKAGPEQRSVITLRAPRHEDYMALGDPYVVVNVPDGQAQAVVEPKTMADYIARCVVEVDPLLMRQLNLADSMSVRKAMLSFFETAVAVSAGISPPSPTV